MSSSSEVLIRPGVEGDVEAVRDLFVAAYAPDYPFKQFYDTEWLAQKINYFQAISGF